MSPLPAPHLGAARPTALCPLSPDLSKPQGHPEEWLFMGWFRPTWASCGTADWSQLLASRTPPAAPGKLSAVSRARCSGLVPLLCPSHPRQDAPDPHVLVPLIPTRNVRGDPAQSGGESALRPTESSPTSWGHLGQPWPRSLLPAAPWTPMSLHTQPRPRGTHPQLRAACSLPHISPIPVCEAHSCVLVSLQLHSPPCPPVQSSQAAVPLSLSPCPHPHAVSLFPALHAVPSLGCLAPRRHSRARLSTAQHGTAQLGLAERTAARYGSAQRRTAWFGTAGHGMGQHSLAWHGDSTARLGGAEHGMAQGSSAQFGTTWHGTAWLGTARHGSAQYSTAWQGSAQHSTARLSTA